MMDKSILKDEFEERGPGIAYDGRRLYNVLDVKDLHFFSFEANKRPGDMMTYEEIVYVLSAVKLEQQWIALNMYLDKYKMTDETKAMAVRYIWHYCRNFTLAYNVFLRIGRETLCRQFGTDDTYAKLPGVLSIFRGCSYEEAFESDTFNPYWSLSRFCALAFAVQTENIKAGKAPAIMRIAIQKPEICAIFQNRYEVAYFGTKTANKVDVETVSQSEVSFMRDYIRENKTLQGDVQIKHTLLKKRQYEQLFNKQ